MELMTYYRERPLPFYLKALLTEHDSLIDYLYYLTFLNLAFALICQQNRNSIQATTEPLTQGLRDGRSMPLVQKDRERGLAA